MDQTALWVVETVFTCTGNNVTTWLVNVHVDVSVDFKETFVLKVFLVSRGFQYRKTDYTAIWTLYSKINYHLISICFILIIKKTICCISLKKKANYNFLLFFNAENDLLLPSSEARCQLAAPLYSFISLFCVSVIIIVCLIIR